MPEVKVGSTIVKLKSGDITTERTDAIVNLNNDTLNQRFGVSKDILAAAGDAVEKECARLGTLRSDEYAVTKAGKLKCKNIIHLVDVTSSRIKESVKRALKACDEHRFTTVSLPAFGTGAVGLTPQTSIKLIFKGLEGYLTDVSISTTIAEVTLVVNRQDVYKEYLKFFQHYQGEDLDVCKEIGVIDADLEYILEEDFPLSFKMCDVYKEIGVMAATMEDILGPDPFLRYKAASKQRRVRDVTVRDVTVEHSLKKTPVEKKQEVTTENPKSWTDMSKNEFLVITLNEGSQEYNEVKRNFLATAGWRGITLIKIEKIQNAPLFRKFCAIKQEVERKNPGQQNVQTLFHGTSAECIKNINEDGFNRSYCSKTVYGKGSYFAVNSQYSCDDGYSKPDEDGKKYIYQATVVTGKYCEGSDELREPPYIGNDPNAGRYDSVTDDINNPAMFVVFYDYYAYPEYLITFKENKKSCSIC